MSAKTVAIGIDTCVDWPRLSVGVVTEAFFSDCVLMTVVEPLELALPDPMTTVLLVLVVDPLVFVFCAGGMMRICGIPGMWNCRRESGVAAIGGNGQRMNVRCVGSGS
jgi:hypothetical protein